MSKDNNTVAAVETEKVLEGQPLAPAEDAAWVETPSALDLRAHIFHIADLKEELVDIPEWRTRLLIRGMTGTQRARVMKGALNADGTPNLERMYPDMVIACCYHPVTKDQIFREADREELNKKAGGILERIALVASHLSGLDTNQVELLRKN